MQKSRKCREGVQFAVRFGTIGQVGFDAKVALIKGGDILRVTGVRPLDLWLKGKENINNNVTKRWYTEERTAVLGIIYTPYELELEGQGSFVACGDAIEQAARISSGIKLRCTWCRTSNTGIPVLHRHPDWTTGEEGPRIRHIWPCVYEVGYAAELGQQYISARTREKYERVMIGLVVLR